MVLRPIGDAIPSLDFGEYDAAWKAVERTQKQPAPEYWLITQPDHAALSGALAAAFVSPHFPRVEEQVARAIAVHDSGWAPYQAEASPAAAPALDRQGKPVSFLEVGPREFLPAWEGSIARAAGTCAAGGYMVSRHFQSLGRWRLEAQIDVPENRTRLEQFVERETQRQQRCREHAGESAADLEALVAVLQFCDLLSLYLCCGTQARVEFPQVFANGPTRIERRDDMFTLTPSPFQRPGEAERTVSVGVEARRFPAGGTTTLAFLLL